MGALTFNSPFKNLTISAKYFSSVSNKNLTQSLRAVGATLSQSFRRTNGTELSVTELSPHAFRRFSLVL
jgi:hypothetical protein